jgi:leader peptidase (prepilin peptidase)/N-methyltransferase
MSDSSLLFQNGLDLSFGAMIAIVLGLVVGSFLNVVIYRLPRDLSIVYPGSHCPGCAQPIRPWQNIPLLSFLILRGQCSNCQTPIHWRYPLVEFITAILFWASWIGVDPDHWMTWITQIRIWTFIAIGIAVTFIDMDHRIIPDELSLGGIAFGLVTGFAAYRLSWMEVTVGAVIGFFGFYGFALLYEKITGRSGLGGGDIKFMGTIGAFLGLSGVWSSILLSSVLGTVFGLTQGWLQSRLAKASQQPHEGILKASIPYGPFLVVGALLEFFFEVSKWIQP